MIIYALIDPRTDAVRYVGKTVRSAHRRLRRHLAESYLVADRHKDRWLRVLQGLGIEPRIEVLQRCSTLDELAQAERQHIARLREAGASLTNATDGGEGMGGWKHSAESRAKIAEALRGKPKSAEHRRNAGIAGRGRKASAETRAKLSADRRRRRCQPPVRFGSAIHTSKLTPEAVDEIRLQRGHLSQLELANKFGVSKTAIRMVQKGINWRARPFPTTRSASCG